MTERRDERPDPVDEDRRVIALLQAQYRPPSDGVAAVDRGWRRALARSSRRLPVRRAVAGAGLAMAMAAAAAWIVVGIAGWRAVARPADPVPWELALGWPGALARSGADAERASLPPDYTLMDAAFFGPPE